MCNMCVSLSVCFLAIPSLVSKAKLILQSSDPKNRPLVHTGLDGIDVFGGGGGPAVFSHRRSSIVP